MSFFISHQNVFSMWPIKKWQIWQIKSLGFFPFVICNTSSKAARFLYNVYRIAQPPFSLNGLSPGLGNPRISTSSSAFCSQYFLMSRTHSETLTRGIAASRRSCSATFRCCWRPSWNLFIFTTPYVLAVRQFIVIKNEALFIMKLFNIISRYLFCWTSANIKIF